MSANPRFLRTVLAADAAASGAMGLMLIGFAGPLAEPFGLARAFLLEVGLILLLWTAFVGWLASRERPSRRLVWAVIAVNGLWVAESAVVLLAGWIAPTPLGMAFVIAQAVAVGVFAELQFVALRRSPRAA